MEESDNHKKRTVFMVIALTIFALLGIAWLVYWLLVGRFYVKTEDAYVHGNQMQVTSQVSSGIKAIYADETDFVEKGQLVVEMEQADYILKYAEMKEQLAGAVRNVAALFRAAQAQQAVLEARQAELALARLDLEHREGLVDTGAISIEEYETYETKVVTAQALVKEAEELLGEAHVRISGTTVRTHPLVLQSATRVREAYLNLIRCRVLAPVSGYIAKRGVQVGDWIGAGETIMMVVPLDFLWMEANFKETKLKKVRTGQPVTFWSDIHGSSVKYSGHVVGYQAGTGTAFSILPAQNASGNWIKIVQRVPIRVNIPTEQLKKNPLVIGLSLHAKVDVHDYEREMLTDVPTFEPVYHTEIYQTQMNQMEQVTPVIETIIETNLPAEYRNG
ncbi:MAG: Multidrug export protein EmrA [Chlamydiales bacterium]|nr:Multidrug export protein EmrA [Chlamydiales bacterium]MCH9635804.1 Multidrug export protein EmrA [Chlamydiales bacterium]MCH9703200.1 HlyD family efflux transporter periplasmic adaptor subunit [Chlamydiota bacterium]